MLRRASLCFLLLSGIPAAIAAGVEVQERAEVSITPDFAATGYLGYLNGESGEYVYGDAGQKVSQLDWKIDNALIIGGDLSYRATDWLSLRAGGWTTLASGNTMDDRDWLLGYNGFDSWTHWSHHPNTDLSKAFQIDVSAAAKFAEYNNLQFNALLGYRFKNMKWDAVDGTFI
jgi:plasminogen activator